MYVYLFCPSFKEPSSAKELKSTLRNTEGERETERESRHINKKIRKPNI